MLDKLLYFKNHTENAGVIWSLEGDHYLAFELSPEGDIVNQAEGAFKSLSLARHWLQEAGVKSISLRQSSAYLEMIGQAPESRH